MPVSPPSRCPIPGCPTLTPSGKLCQDHLKERGKGRRSRETWRSYGKDWQDIRTRILTRHPLCLACGAKANEVDHILPLRDGGTHDDSNLRSLCKPCHSRRTYKDNLGRR